MGNGLCQCNGPDNKRNDLEKALQDEAIKPLKKSTCKTKSNQLSHEESEKNHNDLSLTHSNSGGENLNLDSNTQLMRNLTNLNDIDFPTSNDTHYEFQKKFTLMPQLRPHLITPTSSALKSDDEGGPNHHIMNKLCITSKNISIFDDNKDNQYKFEYCSSLEIIRCDISIITKNIHKFPTLLHLEIFEPKSSSKCNPCSIINDILENTKSTLISFKLCARAPSRCKSKSVHVKPHKNGYSEPGSNENVLQIPGNIEWLSLKNIECQIDISQCHNLIGIQLYEYVKYQQIVWPVYDNNDKRELIPYGLFCDGFGSEDNKWRNVSVDNEINIKFICLCKETKQKEQKEQHEDQEILHKNGMKHKHAQKQKKEKTNSIVLNGDSIIRKCEFDIEDDRKCIILNDDECKNGKLYENIMRYKFKGDFKLKSQKLMEYDDCEWIKRIGMI